MFHDTRTLRAVVPIAQTVRRGPTAITLHALDVYVEGSALSGWTDVQPDHHVMPLNELRRAYFASLRGRNGRWRRWSWFRRTNRSSRFGSVRMRICPTS